MSTRQRLRPLTLDHPLVLSRSAYERYEWEGGHGRCVTCGATFDGYYEPDVDDYPCEFCQTPTVIGLEQLLIEGLIRIRT